MVTKRGKLPPSIRDALAQALMKRYESDPGEVERVLPEVGQLLRERFKPVGESTSARFFPLTPLEARARRESLYTAAGKLRDRKVPLSKEEAIQALEDTAAVLEGPFDESLELDRDITKKCIRIATGLSLSTKGQRREAILREGEPARRVTVLRGVKLNLTWDKKLLSVEVDPKQLAIRARALAFVGVGHDSATDVASRHDEYFVEAILER